ncbi:MAG: hypothetical protein AUK44_02170 [Porphyromonadaceae bacterium CG2_30_38_12]|nr:MAG: hypothetical protein AUK44_02170 [Porphyromonadaceae bacterium CG2_30_38_12]
MYRITFLYLFFFGTHIAISGQNQSFFRSHQSDAWECILSNKMKKNTDLFQFEKGILRVSNATAGYIRTKKIYENYRLKVSWRWTKSVGNSGVLLHIQQPDSVWPICYQVQLRATAAGDIICMNGLWANECRDSVKFTIPKKHDSNEKPVGKWNDMQVVSYNGTIKVSINGLLQNEISGLTVSKGTIGFQAEGKAMEFKNLSIKRLRK